MRNNHFYKIKITVIICFFMCLAMCLASCQKSEYYDDPTEGQQETDAGTDPSSGSDNNEKEEDGNEKNPDDVVFSVSDFIFMRFIDGAYVEGYIIGDCTKSFKYAEFESPFTHNQALLIADSPDERDKDNILAIQLPSGKKRNDLNLVDHPEYLHRKIIVYGSWSTYLYINGIKDMSYYKIK